MSARKRTIEHMFDTSLRDIPDLAGADDAQLAEAMSGWARIEAAAAARRLAAVAELTRRHTGGATDRWSCDGWDGVAAQVAAALRVTHGKASGQMYLATALRERLPEVARLFAEGSLSTSLVSTIVWHTQLITDDDALARVDHEVARDARTYGPMSAAKTAQAIEAIVDRYDPGAQRRIRSEMRSRGVVFDKRNTRDGVTPFWGRLFTPDAEVLKRRLMTMAHAVCDDDPRTIAQRCADALGVLGAGGDRLVCCCGSPACPAADPSTQSSPVLIHVLADEATTAAPADPHTNGEPKQTSFTPGMSLSQFMAPEPEPDPTPPAKPAMLLGGATIPAPLLAELIRTRAKVKPIVFPGERAPEPGYRPSTALDEFVRCRDMTCRFPNCDAPAEFCDIDHTIPDGVGGVTHPSNLKCLCRKHHLLKTFHTGWHDKQYPDGTVEWTSPSGKTYTTYPGSRLLFPALCASTGELPPPTPPTRPPDGCRTLAMPLRKRTRAQSRAQAIKAERALNAAHIAERSKSPPA